MKLVKNPLFGDLVVRHRSEQSKKWVQRQVQKLPSCGLKVRVGCQDRLCVNSDADETLA